MTPYDVEWLVEKRVVRLYVRDNISPLQAQHAYDMLNRCYTMGIAPVHLILEQTGMQRFPLTLNLYNFIIDGGKPEKAGWLIIVGDTRQTHFVGNLFSYVTGIPSRTFPTIEEAAHFLLNTDPTLQHYLD